MKLKLICALMALSVFALLSSCIKTQSGNAQGDDDDTDSVDSNNHTGNDDTGDDEDDWGDDTNCKAGHQKCGWWDDDWSDDDWSDDDTNDNAPFLTDGGWYPPAFTWTTECGDESETQCTALGWRICDADNNMLPDGVFYIYQAGTTRAFFVGGPAMPLSDFNFPSPPDFSNCDEPFEFSLALWIQEDNFPEPGTYSLVCDIEAVDSDGNLSNKLTNLSVQITYEG